LNRINMLELGVVPALLVKRWIGWQLRDFGKRRFGWLGRAHPPAAQAGTLPR
jgi:hypothetical protein